MGGAGKGRERWSVRRIDSQKGGCGGRGRIGMKRRVLGGLKGRSGGEKEGSWMCCLNSIQTLLAWGHGLL